MKLYDFAGAPNPQRVRIFLAEKGMSLPVEQIDLVAGDQHTPEFQKLNPWGTVPLLALDDGTFISEVVAICRYLEEIQPEPPLMGETPLERAVISMWEHKLEFEGVPAVGEVIRNTVERFKGRALPGPVEHDQIPELANRGRKRIKYFVDLLEERLSKSPYVATANFSFADITAWVAVQFASRVDDSVPGDFHNVKRWYDTVGERASMNA